MTMDECRAALDVGASVAAGLVAGRGARCLVTGDMGIGNTTPSAALIAVLCGRVPADVTGRGTGIDDATLARKISAVERAIGRASAAGDLDDARGALSSLGGLEIAALTGFVTGGAAAGVPVVVDGVIALAATVVAHAICKNALYARKNISKRPNRLIRSKLPNVFSEKLRFGVRNNSVGQNT